MKLIYVEIVVLFYLDKLYWFYLCKCLEFNFKNSADTLYLLLLKLFSLAFRSLNIFLFIGLSLLSSDKQGVFFRQHIFLLHLRGAGYLKKHKDCYFGSHLIPPAKFLLYLNDWIGFQFRSELQEQPCDVYIGQEDVRIAHGSRKQNLLLV